MSLTTSTVNFVKGNAIGAAKATKLALIERPCHYLKTRGSMLFKDPASKGKWLDYIDNFFNTAQTHNLQKAYKINGAPTSGEVLTQSVGEFAKKLFKFITNKK